MSRMTDLHRGVMQLAIRDLSQTYANGTQALKNVSLDTAPGTFGLLGRRFY